MTFHGHAMPSLDDESDFSALVERHGRELPVHCYRMLGSYGARLGRVVGRDRVDHPRDPGRARHR
jgi:DNA-directed RNA polymerase specialized sigma24 family protein